MTLNPKKIIKTLKKHGLIGLATSFSRLFLSVKESEDIWKYIDAEDDYYRPIELAWERTKTTESERLKIFESEYQDYLKQKFEDGARKHASTGDKVMPDELIDVVTKYKRMYEDTGSLTQNDIEKAHNTPIEKFITIKRGFAVCPFHNEKTPSLHISENLFNCFGCSACGDTIGFVMKLKNLTFIESVKYINGL